MTIKAWAVERQVCLAVGNLVVVRQVWLVRPAWEEQRPAVRHPGDLRQEQRADRLRRMSLDDWPIPCAKPQSVPW